MKKKLIPIITICILAAAFCAAGPSPGTPGSLGSLLACPAFAAENGTSLADATFTVKAKVSGANTKVTWTKAEGAKYYKVWRSTSENGKKTLLAKKVTKRSYTDKKGASGKSYYYHVRAYSGKKHSGYMTSEKFQTVTRVYVETGHGTGTDGVWDSGCTWKGYQEAKLMIPIAKATADYLKLNGIYVYTDAYNNNNRNLNYTLDFLDSHSVSVFLNIHCDASTEDAGTLGLYRTKEQKALTTALNSAIHEYVEIDDRGLEKRTDLNTLKSSKVHCPASLYETGNIKKDNKTLRNKTDAYGKGFAKGICDYLGLEFNDRGN